VWAKAGLESSRRKSLAGRTGGKQRGVNAMDCLPLIEAAEDLNFMVQCTILTD
jgi:hypothetical protein